MIKVVVTAVIALLIGAIAANSFMADNKGPSNQGVDSGVLQRITSLEERLNQEIDMRLQLQDRLDQERNQRLKLEAQIRDLDLVSSTENAPIEVENLAPRFNRSNFGLAEADEQVEKLVNAGFDEPVAKRLVDQETKMYQAIINARFGGTQVNPRDVVLETQKTIRSELGDNQYETYLEATDRPTKVPVAAITEGSAGAVAGLQVGDEIVNYDGERMFSLLDLQQATQAGTPGQTVIVDVQRGDSLLSFAIPRGQIGISTGRTGFGFNRRNNQ